ncbi:MAG: hypothetical protein ACRC2T_15350 [Thermoguttaceae bacterium]
MFRYELTMRLRQQDQLSPDQAFEKFKEAVSQFSPSEKKDIAKVIEFVMFMDYSSHPGLKSKTVYMNHPLRMAILVTEMFTCDKVEGITTALVHNILERFNNCYTRFVCVGYNFYSSSTS